MCTEVKYTLLASEWGSKHGEVSTLSRVFAIELAKRPKVHVSVFVPRCDQKEMDEARSYKITLVQAARRPGFDETDWLCYPPHDLQIDIVIGHGVKLGCQAQIIRDIRRCKWIQFVHTDPEELGMFKRYSDPIAKGETKHETEVELCVMADFVVAVGPKLAEAYRSYLRPCKKDQKVFELTPGIFCEFSGVVQATQEGNRFRVLAFGRGDSEDFSLNGFDIAAKAVGKLKNANLIFVGACNKQQDNVADNLKQCDIPPERLRVKTYQSRQQLKDILCEGDLAIMPSRTEGFGLAALQALSAGLPILASGNSGFGEALSKVSFGSGYVIHSDDPMVWAEEIKKVRAKRRETRLEESDTLRTRYAKTYNWEKQCNDLVTISRSIFAADESPTPHLWKKESSSITQDPRDQDEPAEKLRKLSSGSSTQDLGKPTPVAAESAGYRNDVVTDGGGINAEKDPALPRSRAEVAHVGTALRSVQLVHQPLLYSANDDGGATAALTAMSSGDQGAPQIGSSSGLMGPAPAGLMGPVHARFMGPAPTAPVRYVDFLFFKGYSVEIIGGMHFKTAEGEFVEMKSGTQYQIHVKNTHAYGCHLDISIDGYDVGGWTVDGGEEAIIDRPTYVPKKFTFYRVKTAPKEAGIKSGRSENGEVKCVFTPEASFDVQVITSGSSQPENVNMFPSATVGDLKREVQSQLKASDDPDQVLVQGDKVLSNVERLRKILEPSAEILRLIDVEIQITVKASSDKVFPVKMHPGKAKVHDLMEQIERELKVPIMDQKLYFGKARLSDTPRRGLPHELICSPQPTVVAIVPEYIYITVEDQNGESNAVKIDQEKNLRALMEELPSCSDLQENEEAMFHFNGKQLCPSKDEGTLTTLGVRNGSRLELKVKILFIEIFIEVSFLGHTSTISVRCSPQETFQDLVKKIEMQGKKREQGRVTFVMEERVFDPDQDKGPLQDYGVTHRSALQMRVVRPDSPGAQASLPADEFNIGVAHKLQKQGDPLDELEERKAGHQNDPPRAPPPRGPRVDREARHHYPQYQAGYENAPARAPPPRGDYPRHVDPEAVNQSGAGYENAPARAPPPRDREAEHHYRHQCQDTFRRQDGSQSADYDDDDDDYLMELAAVRKGSIPSEQSILHTMPTPYAAADEQRTDRVTEPDPAWRAGGTTLQGYSSQQFMTADPIKVDHSKKVELVVRLVAREDEGDFVVFPKGEFKPLSTLHPPAVPE